MLRQETSESDVCALIAIVKYGYVCAVFSSALFFCKKLILDDSKICNDPREARISVEKRLAAGRRTDQIRGERKAGEHGWLLRGTGKPALVLNYCAII